MNALVLLVASRLACWPFEVAGHGAPPSTDSTPRVVPPAVPPPAAPPPAGGAGAVAPRARFRAPFSAFHRFTRPGSVAASTAPPHDEVLRYDVRYGLLGSIGKLQVSAGALSPRGSARSTVRLRGSGSGSVLGLGAMQSQIDTDYDAGQRGSLRWTFRRGDPGAEVVDTGGWDPTGATHLLRRKPGQADEVHHFRAAVQTLDPLGTIWRVRTTPPALGASDTVQVVDGLALWRVRVTTMALADPVPDTEPAATGLRLEGEVAPFFYEGKPDPDRKTRHFTIWLDHTPTHTPLRLALPIGPATLVLRLVEARAAVAAQAAAPVPGARSL